MSFFDDLVIFGLQVQTYAKVSYSLKLMLHKVCELWVNDLHIGVHHNHIKCNIGRCRLKTSICQLVLTQYQGKIFFKMSKAFLL